MRNEGYGEYIEREAEDERRERRSAARQSQLVAVQYTAAIDRVLYEVCAGFSQRQLLELAIAAYDQWQPLADTDAADVRRRLNQLLRRNYGRRLRCRTRMAARESPGSR